MGGGSQKTKSTTKNDPPGWFSDAAKKSLEVADKINQAGYVPYMGNDVAAFTPMQQNAMQSASDWMSAANGTGRQDAMAGMPKASVDGSGVAGYASAPGVMRNLELLRQRMPKQYDQLSRFGGDLLANPAAPPSEVDGSPWQVGAAASGGGSAAAAGAGGAGGAGGFGPFPFGFQKAPGKGNPMIDMMYSMGMPELVSGRTVYEDQFMKSLRAGKDPNVGMPWYKPPAAPKPAAPARTYTQPSKWW